MSGTAAVADRTKPLSHGARWSLINTLATKLATIAVTIVVVRIVTPHDFGVFTVALAVYTIVSAFGELGLSACITRRDLDPEEAAHVVTAIALVGSSLLAGLMLATAQPLATLLGAPDAADAIRVLSICVFLSSLTTVATALLTRDFRQGRLFAANAISFIPANGALILLALHGDGAMAFAWSRVIGQAVAGIVVVAATWPWRVPRWNAAVARRVLTFGLPLAGASTVNYVLLNADFAFIGALLGPALLGIYTLAFNIASWSTSVLGATINGVAMPALSGLRGEHDALRAALSRWMRIVSLVAFPVAGITAALSGQLVEVLYGAKWSGAAPVLTVLSIYGAVFVLSLFLSNLLIAVGRTVRVLLIQLVWLGALVPAIALGVHWLDVEGAAYAHVVVILVVVVPAYLWATRSVVPHMLGALGAALAGPFAAAIVATAVALVVGHVVPGALLGLLAGGTAGVLAFALLALPMIVPILPARFARPGELLLAPYRRLRAVRPGASS